MLESEVQLGFRSPSKSVSWAVTIPRSELAAYSCNGPQAVLCCFEFKMLPLALADEPALPSLTISENQLTLRHQFDDTEKIQTIDLLDLQLGGPASKLMFVEHTGYEPLF